MSAPSTPPRGDEERLAVGLVRVLHGLRGMVRVEVLTDNPTRFEPGSTMFREGDSRPLTVASSQRDGPGLLVRFKEIPDRNAAETLRDAYLEVAAEASPSDGGFYWHDIVGCAVTTTGGEDLGKVTEVFRVGEGEVYVVRGARGEVLVPAVSSIVTELAPAHKRIVVDADALGLDDSETGEEGS